MLRKLVLAGLVGLVLSTELLAETNTSETVKTLFSYERAKPGEQPIIFYYDGLDYKELFTRMTRGEKQAETLFKRYNDLFKTFRYSKYNLKKQRWEFSASNTNDNSQPDQEFRRRLAAVINDFNSYRNSEESPKITMGDIENTFKY